ncbi:MAG: RsmG family class I SAM-dependent methyltransferase [Ilumatobacteraceae bacterium]|nr:RsmG family class I SAM-dependent methyltransferase [Ilumatobacteraceae bacterium]
MNTELLETLRDAQRFGFFGGRPVEQAAEHALGFVDALGPLDAGCRLVDLGSGGGLPGLVLADAYPEIRITLVDRREKRTDFLRRAVLRLDFTHVDVVAADVDVLIGEVDDGIRHRFDVVTARGFGPPSTTLTVACDLLAPAGRVVISEPPAGDRWDAELLTSLGVTRLPVGHVSVFQR